MDRLWHPASKFPVPGIPLKVILRNGEERTAIRPAYVSSYSEDPQYRDFETNEPIKGITQWAIL